MSTFIGGALKLKGGLPIKKKKKAAKEKAEEGKEASAEAGDASAVASDSKAGEDKGESSGRAGPPADTRTDAQKRFEEKLLKRHKQDIKKGKSLPTHVEKVRQFNEYLGSLSEHHDIPKVDGSW